SKEKMQAVLPWEGTHNAYNGFTDMLDQMPTTTGDMRQPPIDRKEWKDFSGEKEPAFNRVKVDPALPESKALLGVTPARFKVKSDPEVTSYGADVEQLTRALEGRGK